MSRKNDVFRKILILVGSCLLLASVVLLFVRQWNMHTSAQKANAYVSVIRQLIPEPLGAVPEARRDNTMSILSVDGTDFVGLLELPQYGSVLPVCADWGKPSQYPCRFSGSIYDGTMQIGGTSRKGSMIFTGIFLWETAFSSQIWKETDLRTPYPIFAMRRMRTVPPCNARQHL